MQRGGLRCAVVFDSLSDKLQSALGDLRKKGKLDEESISRAMREIRLALLEADVNFTVVRDFVARVREQALGEGVTKSLTPGQQVVKVVHDELTRLMGEGESGLALGKFTVILLAGLQGSGKTTAAAKLALHLRKQGESPGSSPPTCSAQRRSTSSSSSGGRSRCPFSGRRRRTRSRRREAASSARGATASTR